MQTLAGPSGRSLLKAGTTGEHSLAAVAVPLSTSCDGSVVCFRCWLLCSSHDSEDSNREDRPDNDYGEESSGEDEDDVADNDRAFSDDDDDGTGQDLDALRARVVRELAPLVGMEDAHAAVGWRDRYLGRCGAGRCGDEEYYDDVGGGYGDEDEDEDGDGDGDYDVE